MDRRLRVLQLHLARLYQCLSPHQRTSTQPQVFHNTCQQAQHASCALEAGVTSPANTEYIYQLWVERIGFLDALNVCHAIRFQRQSIPAVMIHILIFPGHLFYHLRLLHLVKQSATYHLEDFFIIYRLHTATHTNHSCFQCRKNLLSYLARRHLRSTCWKRTNQHSSWN